jgi:hypothetical protein
MYEDESLHFKFTGNFNPDWRYRVKQDLNVEIDKPRFLAYKMTDPSTGKEVLPAWFEDQTCLYAVDFKHKVMVSTETRFHNGATYIRAGIKYKSSDDSPTNEAPIQLRRPDVGALRKALNKCSEFRDTCVAKVDLASHIYRPYGATHKEIQEALLHPEKFNAEDPANNDIVGVIGRSHDKCVNILKDHTDIRWEVPYLTVST